MNTCKTLVSKESQRRFRVCCLYVPTFLQKYTHYSIFPVAFIWESKLMRFYSLRVSSLLTVRRNSAFGGERVVWQWVSQPMLSGLEQEKKSHVFWENCEKEFDTSYNYVAELNGSSANPDQPATQTWCFGKNLSNQKSRTSRSRTRNLNKQKNLSNQKGCFNILPGKQLSHYGHC